MKQYTLAELYNQFGIYKYIRGSHAYGLQKPDGTSDIDTTFIYVEPLHQVLGLGIDYQDYISDERSDNTAYSLRKYLNLLIKSNPNALESLFIPDRCVQYKHPYIQYIKRHRDKFITKQCFRSFIGYAYEQIMKCRSLHKRIAQEKIPRKTPLDFIYTFVYQGSKSITDYFYPYNLKQKYCGLVNIPNMENAYGVYYDWGAQFRAENITYDDLYTAYYSKEDTPLKGMVVYIVSKYNLTMSFQDDKNPNTFVYWYYHNNTPIGYKGIIKEVDEVITGQDLRLSSIPKDKMPICHIIYNKNEYSQHCKEYRQQLEWEKYRNPERYKENLEKEFDRKNIMHACRLLHMGIEIAQGKGFNVDRTNIDRDFLMDIRLGNTSYDEMMKYMETKKSEMEEAMKNSTLPDSIDIDFVNNILLEIRDFQIADEYFAE